MVLPLAAIGLGFARLATMALGAVKNVAKASSSDQTDNSNSKLREALIVDNAKNGSNKSFTMGNNIELDRSIKSAVAEKERVTDSVGENIMKYGVPAGAELNDDTDYDKLLEEIDNPTLSTDKETFGDQKGKFGDWLVHYYIPTRPWAKQRYDNAESNETRTKFLKWLSYNLRKQMKLNGIQPVKMEVYQDHTKLYYSSGRTHILD